MGLQDRLWRLLDRGEPPPIDADEPVELAVVPFHQGPMVVAALHDAGLDASASDAFNVLTKGTTHMRILVRQADLAAAHDCLQRRHLE